MWYTANLIYKSVQEDGSSGLWEERIVLINAEDEQDALVKARSVGLEGEHSYQTELEGMLKWVLDSVDRVYQVDSENLCDGVELFSRYLKEEDVEILRKPFE